MTESIGAKLLRLRSEMGGKALGRLIEDDRDFEGLRIRINRLTCIDDDYRLDRLEHIVPGDVMRRVPFDGSAVNVYRGIPKGAHILPGDWIGLSHDYASMHAKNYVGAEGVVVHLDNVDPMDIYWAGTDEREFFYLPEFWRRPGFTTSEYITALSSEALRILGDGEMSRIHANAPQIEAISKAIFEVFDAEACGDYHGPEHWNRVRIHGMAQARSSGVDPLLPHLFALVHDSQREDEGIDPGHGPRAAAWIAQNRALFSFLADDEIEGLQRACELHSTGAQRDARVDVMCCWDSDRLDLWRVGNEPDPQYLSLDNAKRPEVISRAREMVALSQDNWGEQLDLRPRLFR